MRLVFFVVGMVFFTTIGLAQPSLNLISGEIYSNLDKEPLLGVNVLVRSTGIGTTTDRNGYFIVEAAPTDTLEVSYIGYQTQLLRVGTRRSFTIYLKEGENLADVVITALSIQRPKEKIGYSIQEVESQSIARTQELNPINALQGKIAGLQIDGGPTPGSSSRINLRGIRFLNQDNSPLIIVDGVPINSQTPAFEEEAFFGLGGQDFGNGLHELNAGDIEQISVLKGINAAALYGSRGANGVIIIETKQGKRQDGMGVQLNMFYLAEEPYRYREVQNTYGQGINGAWLPLTQNPDGTYRKQFVDFWQSGNSWGPRMEGQPVLWEDGQVKPYEAQPDNLRDPLQMGAQLGTSLTLMGASETLKFKGRFSYVDNARIFPNSALRIGSVQTKTNATVSDKINIELTAILSTNQNINPPVFGNSERSQGKNWLYNWNRSMRPDVLSNYRQGPDNSEFVNIGVRGWEYYKEVLEDETNDRSDRLISGVKIYYDITDWMLLSSSLGRDIRVRQRYSKIRKFEPGSLRTGGYNTGKGVQRQSNFDLRLDINRPINSDVGFKASLGAANWQQEDESLFFSTQDKGLTKENIYHVSAVNIELIDEFSELGISEDIYRKSIASIFGYVELSFREFLNVQIVGRNDWSSTLPPGENSYFYPSVSASWNVSRTFELPEWLNQAIFRASAAQVRTDEEPYRLSTTYDETVRLGQYSALLANRSIIPPNDLRPSLLTEYEVGTMLQFFDSRLRVDATYYRSLASSQSILAPVPESSGFQFKRFNTAAIRNQGFELVIGASPLLEEDLNWDISLSASFNKNKVLEISEDTDRVTLSRFAPGTEYPWAEIQAIVGQPFGVVLNNDFVYSPDGQPVVQADGTWKQTSEVVPVGSIQPTAIFGLTNSISWKDLQLTFLISGNLGQEAYWGTKDWAERLGQDPATLEGRDAESGGIRWTDANGNVRDDGVVLEGVQEVLDENGEVIDYVSNETIIPLQQAWASRPHSVNVLDGSFIKMREINLSYTFPAKWMNRLPFAGLNLSLVGRDLFYLYSALPNRYNPEAVVSKQDGKQGIEFAALPSVRSYGLILNVRF